MFYGTRDCENMSTVANRKDVIMQNCSVKKWMPFLQYALEKRAKN
jgi:hypothetical protein